MKKNKVNPIFPQRLEELKNSNRTNPSTDIIDEMVVIHKSKYVDKRTMVETSEIKNSNGYKYFKIWELYEPNHESDVQWEYGKKGIVIPIKDAKRLIKRLYQHYFQPEKNPSK